MQVYLAFLGCRLNEAEQASWHRQFSQRGHTVVSQPEDAEVMALNTCAVTAEASKKSRRFLRTLHRRNPSAKLVATGCYATLSPEKLTEQLGVDLVVPNLEKGQMVDKIQQAWGKEMPVSAQHPDSQPSFAMARTRAFIKVQDGCRNRCSYCIVTIARGAERSRKINEIIEEIHHLHTIGYQEVVITGVHLGGYGTDIGENLRSLIEAILDKTSIPRIRIGSLEPWDFPDNFYQLWEDPRLCPHLHLPLQSGSNSVLRRMIRRCSVEEYKELVKGARKQNPLFHISSDFIIGFPGETEEEFQQTVDTIKEIGFGDVHLFRYSDRQGTAAMRLPRKVDKQTIRQRINTIQQLTSNLKIKFQHELLGTTDSILWERNAESLDQDLIRWKGYTRNYMRVHAITNRQQSLFNQITQGTLLSREGDSILVDEIKSESFE